MPAPTSGHLKFQLASAGIPSVLASRHRLGRTLVRVPGFGLALPALGRRWSDGREVLPIRPAPPARNLSALGGESEFIGARLIWLQHDAVVGHKPNPFWIHRIPERRGSPSFFGRLAIRALRVAVPAGPLLARQAARAFVSAASNSSTEEFRSCGLGLVRGDLASSSPNLACRIVRIGVAAFRDFKIFER